MSDLGTRAPLHEVARAKRPEPDEKPDAPPLPSPLPEQDGAKSDADLQTENAAGYRRRVLLVLSSIALALGLYWASGYFFAYTDDAYVTSDLVSIAPYVGGRIVSLNIVDNQTVKKGDLLATIDPTPFRLALSEKQEGRGRGPTRGRSRHHRGGAGKARRGRGERGLASDNLRRAAPITAEGFLSRQAFDTATAKEQEAKAELADAEATAAEAQRMLALHQANVKAIEAEIAYLQWQLEQTKRFRRATVRSRN